MLHDISTGRRWFEGLVQLVVFYSIVIYFIELDLAGSRRIEPGTGFWLWSERVLLAFFVFEYLFRWAVAKHKLRHPFTLLAVIDLLVILPSLLGISVDFRSLKLLRTLRVLRLFKLYRYNTALQNVLHGFRKVKHELAVVGFVVIIVLMFSSVTIFEFEHDAQPDKFAHLSDAAWWSFVTLTTVGYGDLAPITLGGRVIAMITMAIGIGIFGTFISLIGSSFIASMRDEQWQDAQPNDPPPTLSIAAEEPSEVPWIAPADEPRF